MTEVVTESLLWPARLIEATLAPPESAKRPACNSWQVSFQADVCLIPTLAVFDPCVPLRFFGHPPPRPVQPESIHFPQGRMARSEQRRRSECFHSALARAVRGTWFSKLPLCGEFDPFSTAN